MTKQEDQQITAAHRQYPNNWKVIASKIPGKTARQCRDRWNHYLRPDLPPKAWSPEEEEILVHNLEKGLKTGEIARTLGRTAVQVSLKLAQNRREELTSQISLPISFSFRKFEAPQPGAFFTGKEEEVFSFWWY